MNPADILSPEALAEIKETPAYVHIYNCNTVVNTIVRLEDRIKGLEAMLERVTHTAMGLHLLYRGKVQQESDGSHEALFDEALKLLGKEGE